MHKVSIPKSVVDRVIARRGREHVYDNIDPKKTALVVVDMQNAFMLPGVAHTLCPMAQEIVPNVNRLADAVRQTGGAVVWIKTTFTEETLKSWSTFYEISRPEQNKKRAEALAAGSKGHELWAGLDARPDDLVVEKKRFSAFIQGSSNLAEVLRSRGLDTLLITGTVTGVCCEFDRARRHDVQLQDRHGHRRQRRHDRRRPQCIADQLLPHLRRRDVDRHADRLPEAQRRQRPCGGGVAASASQVLSLRPAALAKPSRASPASAHRARRCGRAHR